MPFILSPFFLSLIAKINSGGSFDTFRLTFSNLSNYQQTKHVDYLLKFDITDGAGTHTTDTVEMFQPGSTESSFPATLAAIISDAIGSSDFTVSAMSHGSTTVDVKFNTTLGITDFILNTDSTLSCVVDLTEDVVQQNHLPVSPVNEQFQLSINPKGSTSVTVSNGSASVSLTYDTGGIITSCTPPSGYSVTNGGISSSFVTITADATGVKTNFIITVGDGSLSEYVEGVDDIPGTPYNFGASWAGGDGQTTFSPDGSVDIVSGLIAGFTSPTGYTKTTGGIGLSSIGFVQNVASSTGLMSIASDETGTAGGSGSGGTDVTPGTPESFKYTTTNPVYTGSFGQGAGTYSVSWQADLITSVDTPSDYTKTGGTGAGFANAIFTANSAITTVTRFAHFSGDSFGIDSYIDGVTSDAGQPEIHTITPTPVVPSSGTWFPYNAGSVIDYDASISAIQSAIGSNFGSGQSATVDQGINLGVVTVTASGIADVSDTVLSPQNTTLRSAEITIGIT